MTLADDLGRKATKQTKQKYKITKIHGFIDISFFLKTITVYINFFGGV